MKVVYIDDVYVGEKVWQVTSDTGWIVTRLVPVEGGMVWVRKLEQRGFIVRMVEEHF